ncbi:hypothetical protein K501DRAFT_238556 [Backusella circina FSU 941]|nr:hypothetical protein K501DRAFT_238556 [Backusella circina FSU 941]
MSSDSGPSCKKEGNVSYSPPEKETKAETKVLLPVNQLPLRKRIVAVKHLQQSNGNNQSPDYPPTPSSGSSDSSTSPPETKVVSKRNLESSESSSSDSEEEQVQIKRSPLKKPLKKVYHWTQRNVKLNNKMTFNNGGLPGNPLLWNHTDAEKNAPWSSSVDSNWCEEERANKKTKRGRPPRLLETQENKQERVDNNIKKTNQVKARSDGQLYCICRQHYDAARFMIACDRCDDWFHGECISISEVESEFIDLYFCEKCMKITGKKTSWKPKCANPVCHKAGKIGSHLGHLSKYCSDSCGMQVARARLELAEIKQRTTNPHSMSIPDLTLENQKSIRLNSHADRDDRNRLLEIRDKKKRMKSVVLALTKKSSLLREVLALELGERCGFDSRLLWVKDTWKDITEIKTVQKQVIVKSERALPSFSTCQQPRQRCYKHTNWQKVISLETEQEQKEQFQSLSTLEKERLLIKDRMRKRRDKKVIMTDIVNGAISF